MQAQTSWAHELLQRCTDDALTLTLALTQNSPPRASQASKTVYEIDLDLLPDKPWNEPGALISDYFNYGFDENTWRQYCNKQLQVLGNPSPSL